MIRYLSPLFLVLALFAAPVLALAQDNPRASVPAIVAATPTPAPAVTPIPADADPAAALPAVLKALEAAQEGRYAIAIGFALMAATFLAIRIPGIRDRVPKDYTATFLLGTALFGSFGAALAGGAEPGKAAFTALVCSSMAIAFWEGAVKHIVKLWRKQTSAEAGGGA